MKISQKGFVHLFILLLVAAAGIGTVGYIAFKNGNLSVNNPGSNPSPTGVAGNDSLLVRDELVEYSLKNIKFTLPKTFYAKYAKNANYPIEYYEIDPKRNLDTSEQVSTFLFRLDEQTTTLDQKEKDLIKNWHLLDVDSKAAKIAGIPGVVFTARVNPVNNYNSRFQNNARVKFAIFIKANQVYHLSGDITKSGNEEIFDQILSTFKFSEPKVSPNPTSSAIQLSYRLRSGWLTIKNSKGEYEIGYDPKTQDTKEENGTLTITNKNINNDQYYSPYASSMVFMLYPYDGGSRHEFIYKILGENPNKTGSKLDNYKDSDYKIAGKSCLILDGISISQFYTVWGMCVIDADTAISFASFRNFEYLATLSTLKFLK